MNLIQALPSDSFAICPRGSYQKHGPHSVTYQDGSNHCLPAEFSHIKNK